MAKARHRAALLSVLSAIVAGGFALVVFLTAAPAAAGPPEPAAGHITEVHVKQASIADHAADCPDGATGVHFILNQISEVDAPASISVSLSDGSTVDGWLTKYVGKTAHYEVSLPEGVTVVDAVAVVPSEWSGQFVVSHLICGPPTTTSTVPTTEPTQPSS